MAAAEVQASTLSGLRTIPHLTRTTGWDEEQRAWRKHILKWRLSQVAHAWVERQAVSDQPVYFELSGAEGDSDCRSAVVFLP
jgi:hypothetical protein